MCTQDHELLPNKPVPMTTAVQIHADAHISKQLGTSTLPGRRKVTPTPKETKRAPKPKVAKRTILKQSREERVQKVRDYRFGMSSTMDKGLMLLGLQPNANIEVVLTELSKVLPALVAAEAVRQLA